MLNWHTYYRWFLPIVFGIYMAYQISIDPITWDSAVAVVLFLLALLPVLVVRAVKRYRKRTMFRPEYQHSQTSSSFTHEVEASQNVQSVQLTLRMALETHVEFVAVLFEGQGTLPVISNLYDWQWRGVPTYVEQYMLPGDSEGRWFWRYKTPDHRLRKSRITIGTTFLATDYFDGYIVLRLTCADGNKEQKLPFKVRKRSRKVIPPEGQILKKLLERAKQRNKLNLKQVLDKKDSQQLIRSEHLEYWTLIQMKKALNHRDITYYFGNCKYNCSHN